MRMLTASAVVLWIFVICGSLAAQEGDAYDIWDAPSTSTEESPSTTKTAPTESTTEETGLGTSEVVTSKYPVSEIDRPLALPAMTLEPFAQMNLDFTDSLDNWVMLRMGAGFGITDQIEAGMTFPFSFAKKFKAQDFNLYGLYELPSFLDGLRTAVRLNMAIPMSNYSLYWWGYSFGMLADGFAKYKFHDMVAVTGGLGMGFAVGREIRNVDFPTHFLLYIDAGVLVEPIDPLALELKIGVHPHLGDDGVTIVPLMMRGQYTLIGDLDIFTELGFPDLNEMGADWFQWLFGAAYRIGF